LQAATRTPTVVIESPRGLADASLGALIDLARRADLGVLLGKALDFTTRWAAAPAFDPRLRLISIDPDPAMVDRAAREVGDRLLIGCTADVRKAAETLIARATQVVTREADWLNEARAALDNRPESWATIV